MNDDTKKVETEMVDNMIARVERKQKIQKIGAIGRPITETMGALALGTMLSVGVGRCIKLGGLKHRILFIVCSGALESILQQMLHDPNESMWDDIEFNLNTLCDLYDDYKMCKNLGMNFKEYVKIHYVTVNPQEA